MNAVGEVAVWLALIAAAWNTGFFGSHWKGPDRGFTAAESWSVFVAAAPLALAWASLTGAALRADPSIAAVANRVLIDAAAPYRVAAVLSDGAGAVLTFLLPLMVAMLVVATRPTGNRPHDGRRVAILSAVTMVALAVLVPTRAPFAAASVAAPGAVPLELIHPGAALRGLLALAAAAVGLLSAAELVAARGAPGADVDGRRRLTLAGLLLATLAVAADQWARTVLASGEGGRNAGGLLLWLVLAALAHARARRLVSGNESGLASTPDGRGTRLAHAGVALVVVAFVAHAVAKRDEVALAPGSAVEMQDRFGRTWRLVNQGISHYDDEARDIVAVAVQIDTPRGGRLVTSELRSYHARVDGRLLPPIKARATLPGILQTTLLTFESGEADDVARVRIAFVPLAVLWYPGLLLLLAGLVLAMLGPRAPQAVLEPDSIDPASLVRQWRAIVVDCPVCGRRPEPDARFCSSCGRVLAPCPRCGHVTAELFADFCSHCGTGLRAGAGPAAVSARSIPDAAAPAAAE